MNPTTKQLEYYHCGCDNQAFENTLLDLGNKLTLYYQAEMYLGNTETPFFRPMFYDNPS
jgi:hypothetical protein